MSITRFEPTRLVQSLVATNIEVNQATDRYTITKRLFQGSLSVATALAGVAACGSESLGLVVDMTCWPIGKALGVIKKDVTSPPWFGSFYQTVSGRPSLSDRIERIVSQALGVLVSCIQACLLLVLRDDWAVQLHQNLGNYTSSSKASPSEIPESPLAPVTMTEALKPAPPPPPLAKSTPLRSILKPPPKLEEETPSFTANEDILQPAPLAPPEAEGEASSSPLSTDAGAQPPADPKPATGKKKKGGVRINSKAEVAGASTNEEILTRAKEKAEKGQETAAQLEKDEAAKKAIKKTTDEERLLQENFTRKKIQRYRSQFIADFKKNVGNIVKGGIILRDLANDLKTLPFPTDDKILSGTFGEYVLMKFEESKTPLKVNATCKVIDTEWDKEFTITILEIGKDQETGKDIVLQAALA